MTSTLKVNILIGLPGSGRTSWLKNNFSADTYFDDLNLGPNGFEDRDLDRFGDLINDPNVKEISISDVNFADAKKMFQNLEYFHTLISTSGREETYNFVLFPQSEAHCIRNVKEQEDRLIKMSTIQSLAPVIKQTFLFIKNKFPRYVQEVTFSPLNEEKGVNIPMRQVDMEVLSNSHNQEDRPIEPPKRQGFLRGLLRK